MSQLGKQRIFIGSSSESLYVAQILQTLLTDKHSISVWNQSTIPPGTYTLLELLKLAQNVDFGIFVFSGCDFGIIRGESHNVVRDNVLIEAGIFMGSLGKDKVLLLTPAKSGAAIKIPSDLDGIGTINYPADPNNIVRISDFGPCAYLINERINQVLNLIAAKHEKDEQAKAIQTYSSLSENQKKVLRVIYELVKCDIRKIWLRIKHIPLGELFYRIEKLRLLGVVHYECRKYHVNDMYRNILDEEDSNKTHPADNFFADHPQTAFVGRLDVDPSIQTEFSPPDFGMISLLPTTEKTDNNPNDPPK